MQSSGIVSNARPTLAEVATPYTTEGDQGLWSQQQRTTETDQSLWSQQRISAFDVDAATPETPEAVLRIAALQLEVLIYSGTATSISNRGAAHIKGTATLSHSGNIGIAAHRDGFFRNWQHHG